MNWRFPLPREVRKQAQGVQSCLNPGLWLDHFTEWEERRGELKRAEASDKRQRIPKSLNLPELCGLVCAYKDRWDRMLDSYKAQGYSVQKFTLRAASRVIVGLGAESVLETSIRLHRIYGFPIIPGSALKGLARAVALEQIAAQYGISLLSLEDIAQREKNKKATPLQQLESLLEEPNEEQGAKLFEKLKNDEALASSAPLKGKTFQEFRSQDEVNAFLSAFGTVGKAGQVIFLDGIPTDPAKLTLELDVMNPHYAPYYQGAAPPADYHSPVPVFFLTIGAGSEFLFAVVSKEEQLAHQAKEWLTKALKEMGVGAKTVAGYGLWEKCEETQPMMSASSTEAQPVMTPEPAPKPKPERPEILKELPRKPDALIPAEVVDNTTKPIKVRLLVEGYLDKPVPCSGVPLLKNFPPGTFILVTVSQRHKDGTITMVRLMRLWVAE